MKNDYKSQNFKMNEATYRYLVEIYEVMSDGRISLAKDKLEELLGLKQDLVA